MLHLQAKIEIRAPERITTDEVTVKRRSAGDELFGVALLTSGIGGSNAEVVVRLGLYTLVSVLENKHCKKSLSKKF